jgi:lipopolysaccharide transport system ATP-binding protein
MNDTVIKVENLSKQYRLGTIGTGTVTNDLNRWFARVRGKEDPFSLVGEANDIKGKNKGKNDLIWALKDINFEVKRGEVLGIIGKNGAGKSTLLKILSRVTAPTTGTVKIKGRIASLLEVGTGFHPELTGRENIFLNGAILGMTKKEIRDKFDEIVDFSGVERYLDTPVKRYSSGMYVRLAFAVAAHLEPEILIVDEVLAVGDAEFQKKCLGKMKDVAGQGRTVLFVSHNMQAISTLTTHCLFIKEGRMLMNDLTNEVIQNYLVDTITADFIYSVPPKLEKPSIIKVSIETSEKANVQIFGKSMRIKFLLHCPKPVEKGALSFQINNLRDMSIIHSWIFDSDQPILRSEGIHEIICDIPKVRLYMGKYTLSVHFARGYGTEKFETLTGICPFEVVMFNIEREYKWVPDVCTYIEETEWTVIKKE